jgi:hypothetical protein
MIALKIPLLIVLLWMVWWAIKQMRSRARG